MRSVHFFVFNSRGIFRPRAAKICRWIARWNGGLMPPRNIGEIIQPGLIGDEQTR